MKKFLDFKLYGFVVIITVALIFTVFNFGQSQVKTLGKPDTPGGKPKGGGTPMDAISGWANCGQGYDSYNPYTDGDPLDVLPTLNNLPPNLLLFDTRFDFYYPKCWNGGTDVPMDTNRSFIVDFNSNPCMHYSEMIMNVPPERAAYGWDELFRGEMSAIRNEAGEIVEIFIWFYDQDGWGYETDTIAVTPVMPNPDEFVINVCRTDIPIYPRGHKKYWNDWGVFPLGYISIGDIHFISRQ